MSCVAISGMGVFCAAGRSVPAFFDNLKAGRSALSDIVGMPICRGKDKATQIKELSLKMPFRLHRMMRRAVSEALGDAGLADQLPEKVGLFCATVAGDSIMLENRFSAFRSANHGTRSLRTAILAFRPGAMADLLAQDFGISGPRNMNTNACASGNIAVGHALHAIRSGEIDIAIVCGAEQMKPTMYWGADRAGIIGTGVLPFHKQRDGTVLGDGAAAIVLERHSHALARGAPIHAELAGYGISCSDDPHEIIPQLDGLGVARCILAGIKDAGISTYDISYINAHATGTVNIEISECAGIREAFGSRAAEIPVNSTKSYSGHLSSASAVLEIIATVSAIKSNFVHPNVGLDEPDDSLGVNLINDRGQSCAIDNALSISMGAGGVNTSVVLRSPRLIRSPAKAPAAVSSTLDKATNPIVITAFTPVSVFGVGSDALMKGLLGDKAAGHFENMEGVGHTGIVPDGFLRAAFEDWDANAFYNRAALLGLVAASSAVNDADFKPEDLNSERFGLAVGTSLGGNGTWSALLCEAYENAPRHITPSIALHHGAHLCSTLIAREHKLRGPTVTLTSGGTAGISAFRYVLDQFDAGNLDAAIVVATEIGDWPTARAYRLLGCTVPDCESHFVFDRRHRGTVIGEGAAAFVLERTSRALERGVRPLVEITGVAEAFEPVSLSEYTPDPVVAAAESALKDTLSSEGLLALFASANGIPACDDAEMLALRQLMAKHSEGQVIVSSVPSHLGECGAAGPLLSLSAGVAGLLKGLLPPICKIDKFQSLGIPLAVEPTPIDPSTTAIVVTALGPSGAGGVIAVRTPTEKTLNGLAR